MTMSVHMARLLVLAVIFVNGWTDAPGAIATAVGSGAISFRRGVWMAAACNLIGAAAACVCFPAVADTVGELVAFSSARAAVAALNAALLSIVLWAVAAWRFGLPTSESHALVAGISGAAVALEGSLSCIRWDCWAKVGLGLILSAAAGFWARQPRPTVPRPGRRAIGRLPGPAKRSPPKNPSPPGGARTGT